MSILIEKFIVQRRLTKFYELKTHSCRTSVSMMRLLSNKETIDITTNLLDKLLDNEYVCSRKFLSCFLIVKFPNSNYN